MKCALVGSRFFAASVFEALRKEEGIEFTSIVAPAADDRLALAATAAGVAVHVLENPKIVPGHAIAEGTELIIAAHTHARVSDEALARSRLGGVGYHPSLLPRHRGIAAVEWTILEGDPIAGGSVYHLADGWDAGAIAAQDWCFVKKGETARELWERALAPMGLALLSRVVHQARAQGCLPAFPQDPAFATRAPMIRKAVVLTEEVSATTTSLVVSIVGADRHGIVSSLAERAERFGANWAASRMTKLASEFAGMVHFEVPRANADALATALRGLDAKGLQVVVARSDDAAVPASLRSVELKLVGEDRVGIVSSLTKILAERSISIENMHTEIVQSGVSGKHFKIDAHLLVPAALSVDALRQELGALASEMMVDIALGERQLAVPLG
ncbi:MAG: formyl transferase [Polaromonas sp. 39-63-203]|jgi:glycine cleavage system regulatory protein|uniref:formyltransferase family protein n=1 Tax=Polaromonas sp. TaxID=1869339 RepID=UPI000BD2F807|nr:formyltransferase family protein [Polaromonas sp.]OZA98063.1 MAG: formyl transferase [Polaromonas sp. 39-63-203]HQS32077.1 formyltransferase family protein [Polaromonas sp.]HQS91307.1 formyltransferase family protein [Polaromonas sp.]